MSSFPPKTFTLAEFESLGYLFRVCINFTAVQHLAVPAMASTSGVQRCPVHAQQIWDPLDGCIRFTAYAQVSCQQVCTGIYKQVLLESLQLPRKGTDKSVGACGLFPFPARSPYKGDLRRDMTLSLLSYPELHRGLRGLTAYVPDEENIGISSCTEKHKCCLFVHLLFCFKTIWWKYFGPEIGQRQFSPAWCILSTSVGCDTSCMMLQVPSLWLEEEGHNSLWMKSSL